MIQSMWGPYSLACGIVRSFAREIVLLASTLLQKVVLVPVSAECTNRHDGGGTDDPRLLVTITQLVPLRRT